MSEQPAGLRGVLRSLQKNGVDFVLFGAGAMVFYGYVRNTEDLDIVVDPSEENIRRVHDWLVSIDARLARRPSRQFGERERWQMLKGSNATVLTKFGQIDVVQRIEGMPPFSTLAAECELYQSREGMEIPVMSRATLIELKRRRGSALDLADVEALEQIEDIED